MIFDEFWQILMKLSHQISSNCILMHVDAFWCNLMQFDAIWWNLMEFDVHQISSNFIKIHQNSSSGVLAYCGMTFFFWSSGGDEFVKLHQNSSEFILRSPGLLRNDFFFFVLRSHGLSRGSFSEMHSSVEPLALPHELLLWRPGSPRIPSMALQLECYGRQFWYLWGLKF